MQGAFNRFGMPQGIDQNSPYLDQPNPQEDEQRRLARERQQQLAGQAPGQPAPQPQANPIPAPAQQRRQMPTYPGGDVRNDNVGGLYKNTAIGRAVAPKPETGGVPTGVFQGSQRPQEPQTVAPGGNHQYQQGGGYAGPQGPAVPIETPIAPQAPPQLPEDIAINAAFAAKGITPNASDLPYWKRRMAETGGYVGHEDYWDPRMAQDQGGVGDYLERPEQGQGNPALMGAIGGPLSGLQSILGTQGLSGSDPNTLLQQILAQLQGGG